MADVKDFLINEIAESGAIKQRENQYTCPFCNSGKGENGTGAFTYYDDTKKFYCFACQRGGDIGDFLGYKNNVTAWEGLQMAMQKYANVQPIKKENAHTETESPVQFYNRSNQNKIEFDYFYKRGFSEKTINDFNLYCYKNEYGYIQAVIPVTKNYVIERGTVGNYKRNYGTPEIFNLSDLYNAENQPVFICEGWADVLSFYDVGAYAISINSTKNYKKLIDQLQNKPTKNKIILALDNDKNGIETTEKLKAELLKIGYTPSIFTITNYNDVNEFFLSDKNNFIKQVDESTAQKNYDDNYLINDIDNILNEIKEGKYKPLSTGLTGIDNILNGGLYTGLTVIGAESQMGKSTLVMNIAENLAEREKDILYFSLEMSKSQLLMRGLSKQSYLLSGKKYGYSSADFKNKKIENLNQILESYKKIASHLIIFENHNGMTVDQITQKVNEYIQEKNKIPIVIVDYLQYIYDPDPRRVTDMQQIDYSTMKLKSLAIKNDMIVIAISSLNRASYGQMVDMNAFRGSGKIEYTADFILGLSLAESKTKTLDKMQVDEELQKQPRQMILQVLKGRDIENRKDTLLFYHSRYNYFTDVKTDWNEYQEQQKSYSFQPIKK